jgi:transposase
MKRDGRKLDHKTLEEIRLMAVQRVWEGERPSVVIASYGFSRPVIYRWLRQAKGKGRGLRALRSRKGTGRPPKLTTAQARQIYRWISGKNPRQYGFDFDLWTRQVVAKLVADRFGVKLSLASVGKLLAALGLTLQKPLMRAYERDPAAIEAWIRDLSLTPSSGESTSTSVPQRARKRNAYIVFVDEAGFMLAPLRRRTWAPRGQTPVIKVSDPHGQISVIAAITISPRRRHFGFNFHLLPDNANFRGDSVARFIEGVHRRIRGAATLAWDSIPIHSAKHVRDFLAAHRKIVVEPFPPYAPEMNPVDNVWGYVKYDRLANYTPHNLDELRKRITAEFRRLQKRPDLLESFFNRTGLGLGP